MFCYTSTDDYDLGLCRQQLVEIAFVQLVHRRLRPFTDDRIGS